MAEINEGGLSDILEPKSNRNRGLGLLASAFGAERPQAKGLYFRNKTIYLDGYSFADCRFDNCVLEATSPSFDLVRCVIDQSTSIRYSNYSVKLIQLFNSKYEWAKDSFGLPFVPIKNIDGTITITDKPVV
jgi:hypothetical protein